MRKGYFSHRWTAMAQVSLHICSVPPESLLFAHTVLGSRWTFRPRVSLPDPTEWMPMHIWRISNHTMQRSPFLMRWLVCLIVSVTRKIRTSEKITAIILKIWTTRFYHRAMCPKDERRMTNSVDPDLIWVYNACPDLSVWKQDYYGPGHAKICLMTYANNKGADQPAHPRSLISTFVVHCLDSIMPLVSISEISRL